MVRRAMKKDEVLPIFIGYDSREPEAYEVARASILKYATMPVQVQKLDQRALRHAGLYKRKWHADGHQKIDEIDGKPFSTEFSFSRFLVPALMQWEGWAIFMDCDQLFVSDVADILDEMDASKAVQVCQQRYDAVDGIKMDGMRQEKYFRKNWSSFMLFNCGHATNKLLTPDVVNAEPGSWLHSLSWVPDNEIGELDHGWNWIDGTTKVAPKNVHYTLGGPWFPHMRNLDQPYFEEWRAACKGLGLWNAMCNAQDKAAA